VLRWICGNIDDEDCFFFCVPSFSCVFLFLCFFLEGFGEAFGCCRKSDEGLVDQASGGNVSKARFVD